MEQESRLVLGGHSFISELGSDPPASIKEQAAIVSECLDRGIRLFDTTYQPERVALGRALAGLGRGGEAKVIAWNFFATPDRDFVKEGAAPYGPGSIDGMMRELRKGFIDYLVVHGVGDGPEDARQLDLAVEWRKRGLVGRIGTWWPTNTSPKEPYDFMVRPWNVTQAADRAVFEAGRDKGWEVFGCSPFVRGWKLDEYARRAGQPRDEMAELMLRWSACDPVVDRLIVAMRRREWVGRNLSAVAKGLPPTEERARLEALAAGA
jgi:aryl-alcohol dehydrogenase-like predicted oxidoreductase